ncbi:MAG: TlpA family protein disulfide reductase [Gammaproteobacteria bacterium]|nr:TlpA family protein disulfide reductase [Gammaproteobacteria bacterium]
MRKRIFLLSAGALALGGYFGWRRVATREAESTLADIEFPDVEKKLRHGREWLGKVVVVNHWASWCPPCVEEIPLLIEAQREYRERGLQVVGVAHDFPDAARGFGERLGINYPSLVALSGGFEIMRRQGNAAGTPLPFTVFFDRAGNIAARHLGKISRDQLHQALAALW